VVTLPGVGRVLADGAGRTLYVYLPDRQGRPRCVRVCAEAWPPVVLPDGLTRPRWGPGLRADLLGVVRRADGSLQVTYDRWPLYTYLDDQVGAALGQSEGMGAWWVLAPSGDIDRQPVGGLPR